MKKLKNNYIYMSKTEYEKICLKEKHKGEYYYLAYIFLSKYYKKLKKIFKKNDENIYIYLSTDELVLIDSKVGLIKTLEFMENSIMLNKKYAKKINYLKTCIKYDTLLKKINNKDLIYSYNKQTKKCSCNKIIEILNKDENSFKKLIERHINKKEYEEIIILFSYFIKKYLNEFNYILPSNLKENINFIYKKFNEIQVNKQDEFEKPLYMNNIEINDNFKSRLLNDIPNHFSLVEKAFYIYLKLCKLFTYDVINFNGLESNINHSDVRRIKEINEKDNVILCYEFIAVYAKILDEFGIEYRVNGKKQYGESHINLTMRCDDELITVEPTRGVIDCDLSNAKIGILLDGFMYSKSDKLDKSINKVYKYIEKKYGIKYTNYKDLIDKNKDELIGNNNILTLDDKFEILINELFNSNLPPIEIIKQLGIIRKSVFEDLDFFDYYVIANKEKMEYPNNITLSIVLVFNKFGISTDNNAYYIYNYPKNLTKISKKELQDMFDNQKITYIKSHKKIIPGIHEKEEFNNIKRKSMNFFD